MGKTAGNIIICRADELLYKVAALKPAAVLSIEHPNAKPDDEGFSPRLTDGTPQKLLQFVDSSDPAEPNSPDIEQVSEGLAFVMDHIFDGDVIIHCMMGRSRSVAMALGVMSALNPHEDPAVLAEQLLTLRPGAAPNIIITAMVDKLTGRNGTLVQAVENNKELTTAREEGIRKRAAWIAKHITKNTP